MDAVYMIVIGVGAGIMLFSLLLKQKETGDSAPSQNSTEKAELNLALQRVSKQLGEGQKHLAREAEQTRLELMQEIASLRRRVEELENSWSARQQAPSASQPAQAAAAAEAEPDMLALRERYRRVFELAKEGLSPDEIAKRLGAGRGEIDLIFMLAAKREGSRDHA